MRLPLLLLFIVIPMVELSVMIQVGEQVGSLNTVALVILTAVIGVTLVKRQGLTTLTQAQQKMARGEAPTQEIVGAILLVMAGILLVIPGFITDAIGFILLLPWTRQWLASRVSTRMQGQFTSQFGANQFHHGFGSQSANGDFFEGEFERKEDANRPRLVIDQTQQPDQPSSPDK
ncbi:FxsA family protein [Shewanella sp. NIFS-20-20]|uniref:FxsA family protein n=1 Tax=Shewanella sp. NIFS-20-20 TaxID=2853806 RepID=UPI001C47240B|nr:FxsA family protein [Shewanella sp. NIFS-20-20]MBV7317402.1 FxsA family protein [Shewanella sp. NIFS-20-20]